MYRLVVEPGGIEIPVTPGETLDQALDNAGWYRPWGGCRAGGCGACVATILDSHDSTADDVICETSRGDLGTRGGVRRVLVCVAVPSSDLTITIRNGRMRPRT